MKTLHIIATPHTDNGDDGAQDRYYTHIHLNMDKVMRKADYERELMSISPKAYTRSKFKCKMPTKVELEEELRKEAQLVNYDKVSRGEDYDIQGYVNSKLSTLIELRQSAWKEADDLFNKIEDAKEEKANIENAEAYQREYNYMKSMIQGDVSVVEERVQCLAYEIKAPYNMEMSYNYDKDANLMEVKLLLVDGINVPTWKTIVNSRGKVSIKDKLAREILSDQTDSRASLLFFIASKLFSVSPNIQFLQLSLFDRSNTSPILWIEFDREKFSKISSQTVSLLSEIYAYPHVFDLKSKRGAFEFAALPISKFEKELKKHHEDSSGSHVGQKPNYKSTGTGEISVSFDTAQLLSTIPHISENVNAAILTAKANGLNEVVIDDKYKGLVEELANDRENSSNNK